MQKMKFILGIFFAAATLVAAGGCGASADASAAEEQAFKHPDKAKLPTPPAGTPMITDKGKSSLDTGNKPAGAMAPPGVK